MGAKRYGVRGRRDVGLEKGVDGREAVWPAIRLPVVPGSRERSQQDGCWFRGGH